MLRRFLPGLSCGLSIEFERSEGALGLMAVFLVPPCLLLSSAIGFNELFCWSMEHLNERRMPWVVVPPPLPAVDMFKSVSVSSPPPPAPWPVVVAEVLYRFGRAAGAFDVYSVAWVCSSVIYYPFAAAPPPLVSEMFWLLSGCLVR